MDFCGRRILITGASGFIGTNLAAALLTYGAKVNAVVRPDTNLWRLAAIRHQIILHSVDLRDSSKLQTMIRDTQPEFIFHMARGLAASSTEERSDTLQTNVTGLLNLLEATASVEYQRFICGASSLEYGIRTHPHQETDFPDPASFFGATKLAATILCRQYARFHQRPISILRFFSVYGPWEPPKRLIPTTILAAFFDREILLTEPGYRRDFLFVEDVVQACLATSRTEVPSGEIINIGSGVETSNEDVVALIGKLCERKLRVRIGGYSPHETDTAHWSADILKARRLLKWSPQHTLEEGLQRTIVWMQQHHNLYTQN